MRRSKTWKMACGFLWLLPFLSSSVLWAEGWRQKPFMEWTWTDVSDVLNNSPWVFTSKISFPASSTLTARETVRHFPVIRLLTAKPVRLAYLRLISLTPTVGTQISVHDLSAEKDPKAGKARLERFIEANPDHFLLKGDPRFIILSMTMSQITTYRFPREAERYDNARPDELAEIKWEELANTTFLANQKGKHVGITRFEPPRKDSLGAKFYFPRTWPDGSPLLGQEDTELRFETAVNGRKVSAKFNLRKLVYEEKTEI